MFSALYIFSLFVSWIMKKCFMDGLEKKSCTIVYETRNSRLDFGEYIVLESPLHLDLLQAPSCSHSKGTNTHDIV